MGRGGIEEKWNSFEGESIINQAWFFLGLLKKPNLTHPSWSERCFLFKSVRGVLKVEIGDMIYMNISPRELIWPEGVSIS